MDIGVVMSPGVFEDKLEYATDGKNPEATWNTRRLPKGLTPGWSNRFFVAVAGCWRGFFPLSGEVLWNPEDVGAPYAMIIDTRGWTPVEPAAAPSFRSWRYLADPPTALRAESRSQGRSRSTALRDTKIKIQDQEANIKEDPT